LRVLFLFFLLVSVSFAHWTRAKESVINSNTNLQWQDSVVNEELEDKWRLAESYCKTLNLLGFSDWRLPTKDELVAVSHDSKNSKVFKHVAQDTYWSSDVDAKDSVNEWSVYPTNGYASVNDKCDTAHLRCVRKR